MLAGHASAQDESAAEHLRRGVALRRDNQDAAALAEFRAAWEATHAPRALAQMGLAQQALQQWVDAEASLTAALAATDDRWIRRYRGVLELALSTIASHLGTLDLSGGVDGAEVALDGRVVATLPMSAPVRLPAGDVVLSLRAEGFQPYTQRITIASSVVTRTRVELNPLPPPPPPPPPSSPLPPPLEPAPAPTPVAVPSPRRVSAGTLQRTAGWVTLAGAGVMAGAGVAALVVAHVAARTYNTDAACDEHRDAGGAWQPRSVACASDRATAFTAQGLGIAAFSLAGVLGTTAIVLFVAAPSRGADHATSAIVCGPGPGAYGVSCGGVF